MNLRSVSVGLRPLAFLAVGLLAACSSSATPGSSGPASSGAATPAQGSVAPSSPASASPSAKPGGGSPFHVALAQATANEVTIDVTDASGTLLEAASGTPGDGASVEPYKLVVRNDTPTTLRLTWVGGPCDSANSLSIDATRRQFLLVQPECSGDAIVTDRILILRFSEPIAAAGVEAFLQDGLDTPS